MTDLVLRDDKDGIATLTLNRPDKLNALTVALFENLEAHLQKIETQTDDIGCVVVRGAGRCFSAGNDLNDVGTGGELPQPNYQSHVVERLANLPQPVISAIHGHCYTGALELALAGDIILASENAKFADTHGKWALTPLWGMSQRLPRRVGKTKATEMMLTARTYSASQAVQMGLCNDSFPDDEFDASVMKFCQEMLANSWFTLRAYKILLRDTDGMSLNAGLAHEIYNSEGRGPDMAKRIGEFGIK